MKRIYSVFAVLTASCVALLGQGRVAFNNISSFTSSTYNAADAITVYSYNQGPSGGTFGQGIGGNIYSVQLVWVAGTGLTQAQFDAGVHNFSQACTGVGGGGGPFGAFFANTGPVASGGGFFDAGNIPNPVGTSMPVGGYTMQVLAWYNVGYSSYAAALAGGKNTGHSVLFDVTATVAPASVNSTIFPGFMVGYDVVIPEPSSVTLISLGVVALLLARRKR